MNPAAPRPSLPSGIWVLGFVSLLMDISSEMIHALLPLFMVGTLGMSVALVGLLEGLAEATALILKVFSGVISDWFGKRKPLAVLGYGLGAATKPLFALATGPGMIFTARLLDRVGKGIRGAPRDALVADIAPPEQRGAAFGLRQSLDTVGAFLGPLLAVGLMLLWANDFRAVFAVAIIPAALCVGAVFTLARFSEAFLVLRAEQVGIALALVPLVMVAMNAVFSVTAYPFGKLSDRVSHRRLLLAGLAVLVLADVVLAASTHWTGLLLGVALWGVHMGMTQGLLAAMVADTAPADLRGTAYGFFNLMSGLAMLAASVVAGLLWQYWGPAWTFGAGAMFSAVAMAALLWRRG